MARNRQRSRKRPMAEMNVVPYIDVMLVLLVIFMITAPLLTQGVKVDLPKAEAEAVDSGDQEPLVVTVDAAGEYHLNIDNTGKSIDDDTLKQRVATVLSRQPKRQVLVRGDKDVNYGRVVNAMVLLKGAGVESVGLVTEPADKPEK
ncbi:MAG: protein TolR [Gammaproteobacteria bacterium]|jgi:biopolymer transport protein TolR|nr:protein TolR [Gammaproteobacteria bacterium]